MNKIKIISKIATISAGAAFVFTAIEAILTYFLIIIINQGQDIPAEYLAGTVLSAIMPYLFVAVLATIVAVLSKGDTEDVAQEEALPPVDPETEVNA